MGGRVTKLKRISAAVLHTELSILAQSIEEMNFGYAVELANKIIGQLNRYDWEAIRRGEPCNSRK
jgi:hypothetical protein